MGEISKALFVAWQDQDSRQYYPIGKLIFSDSSPAYCFYYLRGVYDAVDNGFLLLQEFEDLDKVYCSNSLFSVFSNRVMKKSRPDFSDYMRRLGLAEDATDFDILARSGGRRSTDSIELYVEPYKDDDGCFVAFFLAHGVQYVPNESQVRINSLQKREQLLLMWDMQNEADGMALALRTEDRHIVGYMPRFLLGDSWKLLDECGWFDVVVSHVNPVPAPKQQRLLCELHACWPSNFEPCGDEQYQPVTDVGLQGFHCSK